MEPSSAPWRVVDAPPSHAGVSATAPPVAPSPSRGVLAGAGALVAVMVATAVALAGGTFSGSTDDEGLGAHGVIVEAATTSAPSGEIVVDVAGAVVAPGVYRLTAGSRVGDALRAAGGFGPRVDPARAATALNLAALLKDGEQVVVPSRDDPAAATGVGTSEGGVGIAGGEPPGDGLVDLNRATQAELEALPGIGPVTAGKIIAAREATPFASIDDLRTRKLLGQKAFDGLRDLVTVR